MIYFNLKALLIAVLIFVPLEYLFALRPDQKILRKAFFNDVLYAMFNSVPATLGLAAIVTLVMSTIGNLVPPLIGSAVSSQPIWLQVVEIIVIGDIGFYAAHRTFHAVPFLWRFHAIHHSIEELDWLAAHRNHPVDLALSKAASLVPVYLLGFSSPSIALFVLIFHAHGLLLHANIKLNIGPLRWVIASPQFHHWHHAQERAAYDKNFAGQLAFIDAIFGTMHLPGNTVPERYGVDDPIPPTYVEQLAYPLIPKGKANEIPATRDA